MAVIDIDTVIIGAGFAGLGMGVQLARLGKTSFLILERASDIGGTWRDNVYPGVACDIPSHLYSYSFRPKADWSRHYAPGEEIQEYLRSTVRDEGLTPHLRLNASVKDMRWDTAAQRWTVTTGSETYRCRVIIVCAGRLSEPRIPSIPGIETFPGKVIHSARWDRSVDFAGVRVAVVGSGASAVQIVPRLAEVGAEVVLLQRSAPYVLPRANRTYSDAEKGSFLKVPGTAARHRENLFWRAENQFAARTGDPYLIQQLTSQAMQHLKRQVADPELRVRLIPDYTIGCKRILLSDDFYPALTRDNVVLEASGLIGVEGSRVKATSGNDYEVDSLVMATGFHSTRPPFARNIYGLRGTRLSDYWKNRGMHSYASTVVHGFPNMFIVNGPNASLGHNSALTMIEAQLGYILRAMEFIFASADRAIVVREEAQREYVEALDRASASTVWVTGGCRSWYVDDTTGRLELVWPGLAWEFQDLLAEFDESKYSG